MSALGKSLITLSAAALLLLQWNATASACTTDADCPAGYICNTFTQQCMAGPADGDAIEPDGDVVADTVDTVDTTDTTDNSTTAGDCSSIADCPEGYGCFNGLCLITDCRYDGDCPGKGQVCRDDGFCVPSKCEKNTDCFYPDYVCRDDLACAPATCQYDADCSRYSFCQGGECTSNPAIYLHGKGCATSGAATGLLGLSLMALAFRRKRRN